MDGFDVRIGTKIRQFFQRSFHPERQAAMLGKSTRGK
jgi:hypothetical protein